MPIQAPAQTPAQTAPSTTRPPSGSPAGAGIQLTPNDFPTCPKCGAKAEELVKSWPLGRKGSKKKIVIGLFKCPNGHTFRAKIGEIEEEEA